MGSGRGATRRVGAASAQKDKLAKGCLARFKPKHDSLRVDFKRMAEGETPPSKLIGRHCVIVKEIGPVRNWARKETHLYDVAFLEENEEPGTSLKGVPAHDLVFVSSSLPSDPDIGETLAPILNPEPVVF